MDKINEIIEILEGYGIINEDKDRMLGERLEVLAAAEDINALFVDNTPPPITHPFPKKD